jgi:hypothetical protein
MKLISLFLLAAPSFAASALTGFPFTDETLAYSIKLAAGATPATVSLGDARMTAKRAANGWAFELKGTAGVPGYAVRDTYSSRTNSDFCSTDFSRQYEHGSKKGHEEETVDRAQETATRTTIGGGGGKSEFPITDCVKDALTLLYYARREMGQGRVPQGQQFLFGGLYDIRMTYTGAESIPVAGVSTITDKVICVVKGQASVVSFEIYFARDPARTPLLVKVPLPVGSVSLELVR